MPKACDRLVRAIVMHENYMHDQIQSYHGQMRWSARLLMFAGYCLLSYSHLIGRYRPMPDPSFVDWVIFSLWMVSPMITWVLFMIGLFDTIGLKPIQCSQRASPTTNTQVASILRTKLSPKSAILDAGCGTGLSGRALHTAGFTTIDGIDVSHCSLEIAGMTGADRTLHAMDLQRLPLPIPDDHYDGLTGLTLLIPDKGLLTPDLLRSYGSTPIEVNGGGTEVPPPDV